MLMFLAGFGVGMLFSTGVILGYLNMLMAEHCKGLTRADNNTTP